MEKNEGITVDGLAVGLTRPSTKWGVTYPAIMLNLIVSMEAFIWSHNLLWGLIFVPVHGIFYLICLKDPRAFELLFLWAQTKGRTHLLTLGYWKSSSYGPLELHKKPGYVSRRKFGKSGKQ